MTKDDTCYVCIRINSEAFYNELRGLEFTQEEAREIVGWIRQIYEVNPTFLCGHTSKTIKGALAYMGAVVFRKSRQLARSPSKVGQPLRTHTQRSLSKCFNCTQVSLRANYQWIRRFMERNKICMYKGWN